jgi:hypothetical protein
VFGHFSCVCPNSFHSVNSKLDTKVGHVCLDTFRASMRMLFPIGIGPSMSYDAPVVYSFLFPNVRSKARVWANFS